MASFHLSGSLILSGVMLLQYLGWRQAAQADLFLDTLPYNAHTTASDAVWMGLPLITTQGKSFPARVAASILKSANMPELIAAVDAYIPTPARAVDQPIAGLLKQARETEEVLAAVEQAPTARLPGLRHRPAPHRGRREIPTTSSAATAWNVARVD